MYGFLAECLAANVALRRAVLVVPFEELCGNAEEMVRRVADHCLLPSTKSMRQELAGRLHAPEYYRPQFSAAEEAAIEEETFEVASKFRYGSLARKAA